MPRSGLTIARTVMPAACSRPVTPFRLEPSAKAP
jgi:hypothetical protein